jgi:hypothetical protein
MPGIPKILFDRRDHELLSIVNEVRNSDHKLKHMKKLLDPYFHPHGIKEMAAPQGLRIAYAMLHLLDSLDVGKAGDRLNALRSVRDEVLNIAPSALRKNTARVLLQIMKELVRTDGDYRRQLELARDFHETTSGKPHVVRALLRRYHLLEMPEDWNQIAFDDHVHDARTKGRKSPTHLITDAWIKGLRRVTVVYYNYVPPETAQELLGAAEIMEIDIRIGVSLSATFRNRYVRFIWVPRGFTDAQDFLHFLAQPSVVAFMTQGRKVSEYQERYALEVFREFNERHRIAINEAYGIKLDPLEQSDFLSFVGTGQASVLHLAEFIHMHTFPAMKARIHDLSARAADLSPEERLRVTALVEQIKGMDSEAIVEHYLRPGKNPAVPDPNIPMDGPDVPESLRLSPPALIDRLSALHSGYRITLNLSGLKVEDVLELLYDCKGMITHLELFNLKDYDTGKTSHIGPINELQRALNEGNAVKLKRIIREIIEHLATSEQSDKNARIEKITQILRDIGTLRSFYRGGPLKARIGSDSSGRSHHQHGMGLVVKDTLPHRAQKEIERSSGPSNQLIPVKGTAQLRITYAPYETSSLLSDSLSRLVRSLPGFDRFGKRPLEDWVMEADSIQIGSPGNIAALGGFQDENVEELRLEPPAKESKSRISWKYLNSGLKRSIKVLLGFIPAFLTFALTKDWWLLAYFGAFIWFAITGVRNILQSVLGGGGFRRSPLLRWNDYVSWERLTDSLFFTGFSVPLLDWVLKTLFLDQTLGITTATNPAALYAVMALVNGLYLSGHNAIRGLPKGAVFGNFFRTLLSIPLAIALNAALAGTLAAGGLADVEGILQKWAAIISKAASDCVGGFIEGIADRYNNIRMRSLDYATKLAQLFDTYAHLELLFPQADVLQMLASPKDPMRKANAKVRNLENVLIINALDLLYFWMYQPHARSELCKRLRTISQDERQILVGSQFVLQRHREISQLFVDGIVGKNFSRALSFYLDRSGEYLDSIKELTLDTGPSSPCSQANI